MAPDILPRNGSPIFCLEWLADFLPGVALRRVVRRYYAWSGSPIFCLEWLADFLPGVARRFCLEWLTNFLPGVA